MMVITGGDIASMRDLEKRAIYIRAKWWFGVVDVIRLLGNVIG